MENGEKKREGIEPGKLFRPKGLVAAGRGLEESFTCEEGRCAEV